MVRIREKTIINNITGVGLGPPLFIMDRYDIISGMEPSPDSTRQQSDPVDNFLSAVPEHYLGLGSNDPMPPLYGSVDTGEHTLIDISFASDTDSTANFPAMEVTDGDIVVENGRVRSLDPVSDRDLTTKSYVDHLFHKLSGASFRDRFIIGLVFSSFIINIMLWISLMITR